jgi:hypothetical protein
MTLAHPHFKSTLYSYCCMFRCHVSFHITATSTTGDVHASAAFRMPSRIDPGWFTYPDVRAPLCRQQQEPRSGRGVVDYHLPFENRLISVRIARLVMHLSIASTSMYCRCTKPTTVHWQKYFPCIFRSLDPTINLMQIFCLNPRP